MARVRMGAIPSFAFLLSPLNEFCLPHNFYTIPDIFTIFGGKDKNGFIGFTREM